MSITPEVLIVMFALGGFVTGVLFGGVVGYIKGWRAGRRSRPYGG